MKHLTLFAVLLSLAVCGFARQAQAQSATVPGVQGVQQFTVEAQYMSLPGYFRWQYYKENNVWISQLEAQEFVHAQTRASDKEMVKL